MKWAVLVGGTGSNLRAILESGFPVGLVLSHRDGVGALEIAREFHVAHEVLLPRDYPSRAAYDAALCRILQRDGIERVALAGFLRWLTAGVTDRFSNAIINLHPSLLPAFAGLQAIERAFDQGVLWSGVTVHFVDEGHDSGPIVAQVPVLRRPDDSLESFSQRMHRAEHALYPRVIRAVDRGDVRVSGGRAVYTKEDDEWMHGR